MFENLEKKLVNLLIFTDLAKMKKKIPEDFSGVKRIQDRRVRRLVRKAYRIPFYKERFDAAGVKPEDIRTGADLTRLPLLHKEELRVWMKEEAKNPRYDNWYHDTTSGSSGATTTRSGRSSFASATMPSMSVALTSKHLA